MNESPNKRAVLVGVFVIVGIIFLVAGILTIGNLHSTFSTKLHVITLFDNVNGLQKGNNIWFSGVKIGTVKKVEFFGTSRVRVVMNIDEKVQQYIRKDAKVKVSTDGFIGNKILEIYGGTFSAGPIEENDTLGVDKTFSTDDIMNTLQENNKNLASITGNFKTISEEIHSGKGSIGKLIKDESLYNNLAATSTSLKNASDKAGQVMSALSVFSSGLNKKGTFAHQLVTDTVLFGSLKQSAGKLNVITDSAAALVSDLNRGVRDPRTPAGVLLHDEEAGAHLKLTLKNLDSGSKKLDEDLEAAQHSFLLRKYFKKKEKAAKEKQ